MNTLQKKTIITQRSLTYTYYVSAPIEPIKTLPALFFIHGFPDSAHLWSDVIKAIGEVPNKIIVPDCLGYAGTDKPQDTSFYTYKGQADDLVDILHAEGADSTIIIGHDWGSPLTQRTYLYHRELFSGMVLLNTGYMLPSDQPFDLDAINEYTEKALGYPQFSYWNFFLAPDAAEVVDGHLERMWQVMHGDVEDWMKKLFCVPDAMRTFLLGSEDVPLKAYARDLALKDRFMRQFKDEGFASSLQMYKATASGIQAQSDSDLLGGNLSIDVPLLFMICTNDAVCVPAMMAPAKEQALVPHLKEVYLEAAHWSPLETPDEVAAHIKEFLGSVATRE